MPHLLPSNASMTAIPGQFADSSYKIVRRLIDPHRYDRRVHVPHKAPLIVLLSLAIHNFGPMDHSANTLHADATVSQIWRDRRLKYKHKAVSVVHLSSETAMQIWTPDTDITTELRTSRMRGARIYRNGTVVLKERMRIVLLCEFDFTYYPWDKQLCEFTTGSFNQDSDEMTYRWNEIAVSRISKDFRFSQLTLKNFSKKCCSYSATAKQYQLRLELSFGRSRENVILLVFIPLISIVSMSWIPIFTDLVLSFAVMLMMSCFMGFSVSYVPKTSYIKYIDVYIASCFLMVMGALIQVVVNVGRRSTTAASVTEQSQEVVSSCSIELLCEKDNRAPSNNEGQGTSTWISEITLAKGSRMIWPIVAVVFHVVYFVATM